MQVLSNLGLISRPFATDLLRPPLPGAMRGPLDDIVGT